MGYIVRMPKLGVEMQEGELLEWHVDRGGAVSEEAVVAEIESEKTVAEVTAREDGVLRRVFLAEGETGPPGAEMGIVAGADEDIGDLLDEADAAPVDGEEQTGGDTSGGDPEPAEVDIGGEPAGGAEPAITTAGDGQVAATPRARVRAREEGVDLASVEGTGPKGSVTVADVEAADDDGSAGTATNGGGTASNGAKASPRARRRADEAGVAVGAVEATGPAGSVVEADVERAIDAGAAGAGSTGAPGLVGGSGDPDVSDPTATTRTVASEREQSRMRRTIARRLSDSWREAPHVTVDRAVDVEPLFSATAALEEAGYDVSLTDVLLVAASETLADHPEFNATFEDGVHTTYEEHNVGVAVDIEDGLVTPVLPAVNEKSVDEIAAVRERLTKRATSGEYTSEDLSGGTFTVSNLGMFGVTSFTPIINPPEVAILGVNTVEERPVKGENGVEFRREMTFSLSFDHRVVDGADAARFLDTLADHVTSGVALVL